MSQKANPSAEPPAIPAVWSLEGIPPAEFREWLAQRREPAVKKAPAALAITTYEALSGRGVVTEHDITPVVTAARSPNKLAWDMGVYFLTRLAARHEVARAALDALATDRLAELRGRALMALNDALPKSFCIDLVRRGLADRSRRVRDIGADMCRRLLLVDLLPELIAAAEAETHAMAKLQMEIFVGIIREGYHIYPDPDGTLRVVVRITEGVPAAMCFPGSGWHPYPITDYGVAKALAERIRRETDVTKRPFRWDSGQLDPATGADA